MAQTARKDAWTSSMLDIIAKLIGRACLAKGALQLFSCKDVLNCDAHFPHHIVFPLLSILNDSKARVKMILVLLSATHCGSER
eukprot:5108867-Amphidinium_carterae.3